MKDNKLIKSGVSGVVDGENQTVGDDELELINRFTRRNLAKNEVYAFSVCCVTTMLTVTANALQQIRFMSLKSFLSARRELLTTIRVQKIQTARIFSCKVEKIDGQKRLWVTITTGSRQGHIFPFVRATGILSLQLTAELSRK